MKLLDSISYIYNSCMYIFYHSKFRLFTVKAFLFVFVSLFGCNPNSDNRPIPSNTPPAISIISPSNTTLQLTPGGSFSISMLLADNEALNRLRVVSTISDEMNVPTGEEFIVLDQSLVGTISTVEFSDKVDEFPAFFKLTYRCIVQDVQGAADTAIFFISILPEEALVDSFQLLSFENISLHSRQSNQQFGYNFTNSTYFPENGDNPLEQDIAEETQDNLSQAFQAILSSPSNDILGEDSIFVLTNDSQFNFEEASYNSLLQAFRSSTIYYTRTPSLQVGDIVIVSLIKAPQPQFGIMKILDIIDESGYSNDKIIFNYKVSSP